MSARVLRRRLILAGLGGMLAAATQRDWCTDNAKRGGVMTFNGHPDHLPNHLRYQHGTTRFSDDFGELHSVTPVNLVGEGHVAHLEIRSCYGLRLDVSAAWLTELVRQAPAALAKLPLIPELHDAVLDGEGA